MATAVDHVIPLAEGARFVPGLHERTEDGLPLTRAACSACNGREGQKLATVTRVRRNTIGRLVEEGHTPADAMALAGGGGGSASFDPPTGEQIRRMSAGERVAAGVWSREWYRV